MSVNKVEVVDELDVEVIAGPVRVALDGADGTLELLHKRESGEYLVVFWPRSDGLSGDFTGDILDRAYSEGEAISQYLALQLEPSRQRTLPGIS